MTKYSKGYQDGYLEVLIKPAIKYNILTFIIISILIYILKDKKIIDKILATLIALSAPMTFVAGPVQDVIVNTIYNEKMPVYIENEAMAVKAKKDDRHTYYSYDYSLIDSNKYDITISPASSVNYKILTDFKYIEGIGQVSILDIVKFIGMFSLLGILIPSITFLFKR
ncbi:hypothetical protein [Clostridium beijerinckii]|uniref:ABC-2 family transporter protein n=1 Tax=Clostridium beijerinckii TaxID=1520 RepID=A0AAX0BCZ3_CLOBE|nr:hypothetical protein [Clostridium beijerinckii]NRT92364.1 hypothetical protein [Clostridium beijerinckii]NYC75493.1 hypothetical protein [Clostridium beijerinckii]